MERDHKIIGVLNPTPFDSELLYQDDYHKKSRREVYSLRLFFFTNRLSGGTA